MSSKLPVTLNVTSSEEDDPRELGFSNESVPHYSVNDSSYALIDDGRRNLMGCTERRVKSEC